MEITHVEPHTELETVEALEHGLRRLMWLERKYMEQSLHQHNLTVPQFLVLVNLFHSDQGYAMGDLADKLFQSHATTTGIIDRLESERLVARVRGSEEDRRKVMVQITPKGRHLFQKAIHSRRERTLSALAHFPPEELQIFVRLLDTYLEELEREA